MRYFPGHSGTACIGALFCAFTSLPLHAGMLPIQHLDAKTLHSFDAYIARFEKQAVEPYVEAGKLWMDSGSCCMRGGFPTAKPVLEGRENADVESGSIHHFSGALHVPGGTIDDIRRIMEDYPNYPKYFKPDVVKGGGSPEPDSTSTDEHFRSRLSLSESTLWITVQYDCVYDTHYKRLDANHWTSKSTSDSVKELRDAGNSSAGYYPEGDDHGFVWRTNTYWFARQSGDGIDLELDSITLSRPNPSGFAWYGGKRSHDAVDKMLRDTRAAIQSLHRRGAVQEN